MPWLRIENVGYWLVAVATFLGVAIWESVRPKSDLCFSTERRWRNHGIILVISTLISMGVYRASPVMTAASVSGSRFGLLNQTWLPFSVRCILAVLLLDLVKYAVHRACHSVPLLWRVHQVHHSDPDFDVSTALRFHPLELVVTHGAYLAAIVLLAPPLSAVVVAELAAGFQSFFGHANARLPKWLEGPVRTIFVTPDMHRIHHSEEPREQTRNLGDIFPWWDLLLGTYVAAPAAGQDRMVMGLSGFKNAGSLSLGFMLRQPFMQARESATESSTIGDSSVLRVEFQSSGRQG
jgi:sterol desaturase/sphingolipid hydroxylase (fatty acid hydroxylase superfamily)